MLVRSFIATNGSVGLVNNTLGHGRTSIHHLHMAEDLARLVGLFEVFDLLLCQLDIGSSCKRCQYLVDEYV